MANQDIAGSCSTIYCCPFCQNPVIQKEQEYLCTNNDCCHSNKNSGFGVYEETPVFISQKTDSVCDPNQVTTYVPRSQTTSLVSFLRKIREDPVTEENCISFCKRLKHSCESPNILIIGAGNPGLGNQYLWADNHIQKHGIDIYKTDTVDTICDAHYLPFKDKAFDGVWIQAVLEHVVEPSKVVNEIHRVLRPNGLVYAETPFMQQVHEGAYDFTRFTILGHRYLFRDFVEISVGPLGGPDLVLAWGSKTFIHGITRSKNLGRLSAFILSILLRPFRRILSHRSIIEGCSGTFFFGEKATTCQISHSELVDLYSKL